MVLIGAVACHRTMRGERLRLRPSLISGEDFSELHAVGSPGTDWSCPNMVDRRIVGTVATSGFFDWWAPMCMTPVDTGGPEAPQPFPARPLKMTQLRSLHWMQRVERDGAALALRDGLPLDSETCIHPNGTVRRWTKPTGRLMLHGGVLCCRAGSGKTATYLALAAADRPRPTKWRDGLLRVPCTLVLTPKMGAQQVAQEWVACGLPQEDVIVIDTMAQARHRFTTPRLKAARVVAMAWDVWDPERWWRTVCENSSADPLTTAEWSVHNAAEHVPMHCVRFRRVVLDAAEGATPELLLLFGNTALAKRRWLVQSTTYIDFVMQESCMSALQVRNLASSPCGVWDFARRCMRSGARPWRVAQQTYTVHVKPTEAERAAIDTGRTRLSAMLANSTRAAFRFLTPEGALLALGHGKRRRQVALGLTQIENNTECVVCADKPSNCIVSCGHVFCTLCTKRVHAARNKRCPLCRHAFTDAVVVSKELPLPSVAAEVLRLAADKVVLVVGSPQSADMLFDTLRSATPNVAALRGSAMQCRGAVLESRGWDRGVLVAAYHELLGADLGHVAGTFVLEPADQEELPWATQDYVLSRVLRMGRKAVVRTWTLTCEP
jgi:hypothetical protein